ncbi:MAG: phenylalanine--tRNA ligase subunit alpha [Alphaproteobacteria bacterium]|jgi:phenylalanyl-tRNA synthetase alpha chain
MADIKQVISELIKTIDHITTLENLEEKRIEYLGKSGILTEEFKKLGILPPEEKKEFGNIINSCKVSLTEKLESHKALLESKLLQEKLKLDKLDVSLPIREQIDGTAHPISQAIDEIINIFGSMGFAVAEGPDIDNDFNNFSALNIPENHPARQMHDTFYMPINGQLLRTHTSTVQIRKMSTEKPPFRFIVPGRVYRCDSDMTHTPMFHQIEGVCIDKKINMGHLKGCLEEFLQLFFETQDIKVRFRPSFFPFTEPSAEVDIGYSLVGDTIKIGNGDSWLEILGCGMVHPNVLANVGIDPNEYQGFAFGMGVERVAMLKYGISDLRTFFEGDLRWLKKYGFNFYETPTVIGGAK